MTCSELIDMSLKPITRLRLLPGWVIVVVASLIVSVLPAIADTDPPVRGDAASPSSARAQAGPSAPDQLIQPDDLARLLVDTTGPRPVVLHVGFKMLFRSGHIAGSRHVGPASTPDGLVALKQVLREIPHQQPIVLYCGCCPWADCPNVRPALLAAREVGAKDVRLLHLPQNLQHDWIDKGLPIGKGDE
jgi:thiosulfate/3-mercaptopyruvate sulfurtransferase